VLDTTVSARAPPNSVGWRLIQPSAHKRVTRVQPREQARKHAARTCGFSPASAVCCGAHILRNGKVSSFARLHEQPCAGGCSATNTFSVGTDDDVTMREVCLQVPKRFSKCTRVLGWSQIWAGKALYWWPHCRQHVQCFVCQQLRSDGQVFPARVLNARVLADFAVSHRSRLHGRGRLHEDLRTLQ
jgi:hypothetical protein